MANKQHPYTPKLHDLLVWSLAAKGYTNKEICEVFNMSEKTFIRWRKKHKSFDEKFIEGRKIATAQVEEALFKRAIGYKVTEKETTVKWDNEGNQVPVSAKLKEKYIIPDTTSMIFWLKNRDSENWKDRIDILENNGDGLAESLLEQIQQLDLNKYELIEKHTDELEDILEIEDNTEDEEA